MSTPRFGAAAALLPDGTVLVAGGQNGKRSDTALKTAELWDPVTRAWAVLPAMSYARVFCSACVLPSGRVAVVGAKSREARKTAEAFDPQRRVWEPIADLAAPRGGAGVVAVAGGMLAIGTPSRSMPPNELCE